MRQPAVVVCAAIALAIAACGEKPLGETGRAGCGGGPSAERATAGSYEVVLVLSEEPVPLYTRAEARARHPADGEIVLGPKSGTKLAQLPGMAGTSPAHIDLRVCSAASGKPVRLAPSEVIVIDRSSGASARWVVATLVDARKTNGVRHFGGNLALPHHARVEVTVAGKRVNLVPPTD